MKELFLAGFFLFAVVFSGAALDAGDEAGTFVNPDLKGDFVFSKDYIGNGWVLMDFFATWCGPCQEELPELEKLYVEFSGQGLKAFVFAVDTEGSEVVKPFFGEHPTAMTVLIDKYMVTAERYDVEGIPVVFLVGAVGFIVVRGDGFSLEAIEEMRGILSAAFAE